MKYISLLFFFALTLSCQKELPERPADYEKWYNGDAEAITEIIIPCEDELISNYYETGVSFSGFDSYEVSDISTFQSFDEYSITANHAQTSTQLSIIVSGMPGSIIGRKSFKISENNFVNENFAKIYIKMGSFDPIYFNPIEADSLYVDFYQDSAVFSMCNVQLRSSVFSQVMNLTGKIVSEF